VLTAFVLASLVLAATPGPGVLYIVTQTLAHGRRAGLASVAGVALGNACNALGAALGLGVLLTLWPAAFTVLKWAGAAYLVWLGVQALRTLPATHPQAVPQRAAQRLWRDGFWVALLNPKTALFFAAFLPQFIPAQQSVVAYSVGLGALFVGIAALTDSVYVLLAAQVSRWLAHQPGLARSGRLLSAVVFIALGVAAVVNTP
jgi:threonine/homoserine/homoserine lactone efflux protein